MTIDEAFEEQEIAAMRAVVERNAAEIKQRLDEQLDGIGDHPLRHLLCKNAAEEYIAYLTEAFYRSIGYAPDLTNIKPLPDSILVITAQHGALTIDIPMNLEHFVGLQGTERDKAIAKYAAEFAMKRIAQCVLRNRTRADIAAEALTHETVEVENE